MRIRIGKKISLCEEIKPNIYEVVCRLKVKKEANREALKSDIRAITGVTIVTSVSGSEHKTEMHSYQNMKIKFQPYQMDPAEFLRRLAESLRKLSSRGLASFEIMHKTLKRIEL